MEISWLEKILLDVKISCNRQIALAGSPWYDPVLTFQLKKDIELLEKQKKELIGEQSSQKFKTDSKCLIG